MELFMREKELLIMFGSERRLDTHKRLQNAIPYMTDSLYKASATALWNKLYNNISDMNQISQMDTATSAFFSHQDPVMVEWFVKMVEERKSQHDSNKEKKNW